MGHFDVIHMPCHSHLVPVYCLVCDAWVVRIEFKTTVSFQILHQLLVEQWSILLRNPYNALCICTYNIDWTLWSVTMYLMYKSGSTIVITSASLPFNITMMCSPVTACRNAPL